MHRPDHCQLQDNTKKSQCDARGPSKCQNVKTYSSKKQCIFKTKPFKNSFMSLKSEDESSEKNHFILSEKLQTTLTNQSLQSKNILFVMDLMRKK